MKIHIMGAALLVAAAAAVVPAAHADKPEQVTICHAAGLASDPANWVTLTLPWQAVYGQAGHFNENGTTQAGHEADYLGACIVEPEPTETATPTPTPTPTETPSEEPTETVTMPVPTEEPLPPTSEAPSPLPTVPVVPEVTTPTTTPQAPEETPEDAGDDPVVTTSTHHTPHKTVKVHTHESGKVTRTVKRYPVDAVEEGL